MTKGTEKIKDKIARGKQGKRKANPISNKFQSTCKVRYLSSKQCSSEAPEVCMAKLLRII